MLSESNNKDKDMDLNKVPFEIALNQTGFGVYSYMLTLLTGISIISYACIVFCSTIIVPISACELETTSAQQGLLVAGPVIGGIIGSVVWGYLADTRGRRSMLLLSFMLGAIINGIASLSVNWIMLLVVQFFAALSASAQYSLPMTMLSECVPLLRRNLVILIVASIFLLAQGIMSLLAMPIVPLDFSIHLPALGIYWNPWRTVMIVYSLPSLVCFVWIYFMQESPKYVFSKGDEEGALKILRTIHRVNNGRSKEEFQVKGLLAENIAIPGSEDKSSTQRMTELFKAPLLKYFIIMTTLSIFLTVNAFVMWLPTIANQFVEIITTGEGSDFTLCDIIAAGNNAEANPDLPPCALNETALLIVFAVGCFQSLLNLLLSFVVNKAGRRNLVIVIAAITGVSGILINLVPNAIGSGVLFLVFLLAMVLYGLYTTISVALFPTHLRALAVSLTMTGGRIVLFAVVQILNFLLINNCNLGFYIFASILASSAIIASFLPDDRYIRRPAPPVDTKDSMPEATLKTSLALAVSLTMTGGRIVLFAVVQILNFLLINNCNLGFYIFASILASSAIIASFLPDDRYIRRPAPPVDTKDSMPEATLKTSL